MTFSARISGLFCKSDSCNKRDLIDSRLEYQVSFLLQKTLSCTTFALSQDICKRDSVAKETLAIQSFLQKRLLQYSLFCKKDSFSTLKDALLRDVYTCLACVRCVAVYVAVCCSVCCSVLQCVADCKTHVLQFQVFLRSLLQRSLLQTERDVTC